MRRFKIDMALVLKIRSPALKMQGFLFTVTLLNANTTIYLMQHRLLIS